MAAKTPEYSVFQTILSNFDNNVPQEPIYHELLDIMINSRGNTYTQINFIFFIGDYMNNGNQNFTDTELNDIRNAINNST